MELLDVGAAGVMLVAPDGDLRVAASSNEAMRRSRVVIEQAKDVLSERLGVEMGEAFPRLRSYARGTTSV